MGFFRDRAEVEQVMGRLFERLMAAPDIAGPLTDTALVVRFRYPDLDAVLTFDFKRRPPTFSAHSDGGADVEMVQSSDTAHEFWLGRLNAVRAIATGRVRARGEVAKALRLLPAIRPAFQVYAGVLQELGLAERIVAEAPAAPGRGRTWRRLLKLLWRRRAAADLTRLPRDAVPPATAEPRVAATGRPALPDDAPRLHLEMLYRMGLIRAFEEELAAAWEDGELPTSAIHLSTGQEAVAVGVCFALRADDVIATTHRGHGHMLAKGAPADRMMAEIFGKETGLCAGKGGSMHVTDASIGAIGANGIVGSSPLLAVGAALAFAYQGRDSVAVAFMGDGATNQGMFHEALNLASVWKLPVLFVIENNGYGEFTPQACSTNISRLADRAPAYGIQGVTVDGNDVDAVYRAARALTEKSRAGAGPALLECLTYRWRGHMEGDAQEYRSATEVAEWKLKDPCVRYRRLLMAEGVIDEAGAQAVSDKAVAQVEAALDFARRSPEPAPATMLTHVFAPEANRVEPGSVGASVTMTGSAAINLALREEMERDERVVLLGEDIALGGYLAVTKGLVDDFGRQRVRDTPISENAILGGAVGAAMNGLRPVAEILFADFLTVCADPLVNQAAKLRYMSGGQYSIPMVVRTPGGAGLGMAAQHSQSLQAMFMNVPGLIIAAPGTPRDSRALLKAAIRSDNPVLFFEHKLLYLVEGPVPTGEDVARLGEARIVRAGKDVTVVALSYMVQVALEAAAQLERRGIDIEVIDPLTVAPLDSETILASVTRTRRLVTIEESPMRGGFGAEVVARVAAAAHGILAAPPVRVGAGDHPIPYNKALECLSVPDVARLVTAVMSCL
ncbi:MAG: SCP2 sterol-binding domain-containing protein [Candidatus Schekmanbacteria bacterium]|nr:SCP2 sterol-binding domain-containing protein [Candidatus Schekmanbacteria bacterium]